jgi:hypothetical protein
MAVKAINDSAGLNNIILILLVFDVYLWLTKINLSFPLVIKRAKAIYTAIKKVRRLYTERQVKDALIIHNSLNTKNILNLLF